jgi:biotin synthase
MNLLINEIWERLSDKQKVARKIENGDWDLVKKDEISELLGCLKNDDKFEVYNLADKIRKLYMGDQIHIRSIIEFSNFCVRKCSYCGINILNSNTQRYRLSADEIIEVSREIKKRGHSTVVLQSGEDPFYDVSAMTEILRRIKKETGLAVTVSVGEKSRETFEEWKDAGMDRYLMRFETSNKELYKKIHSDSDLETRLSNIRLLKSIGVQTGSGFLIGLAGQTKQDLVNDIHLCRSLDLDMIGCGPFIPHPETPLGNEDNYLDIDYLTGVISVLRIVNFDAHIPATTAFDAIDPLNGRNLCLKRGANVFMPNGTPQKYRARYQLYPGKPCINESGSDCAGCVALRVNAIGRSFGKGPGHSIHKSINQIKA